MLKKILKLDKYSIFPILLLLVCVLVCYKNYTPGTYLTGWDTLHPEFNYGIYWKRIISGAWQSHQGLGSPASQAHASEIPRILIIQILDIFFAKNLIRYLFVFLMLTLGPLGVHFFLKKVIFKNINNLATNMGSFLGGLFYLLNLGTLQNFNVPLEMFLVQYAFLGWVFIFLTRFYYEGKRRDLILFSLITLIGAPQAHTPTLFYVYVMFLFLYLVTIISIDLLSKRDTSSPSKYCFLSRGAILFSFTLLINFFWLLPNIYYGISKGSEVPLSKIHHLFSEEAFLVNKKYGNIKDISILKNFLFDWGIYVGGDSYGSLLGPWIVHLKNPFVSAISIIFPILISLGIVISIIKKEKNLVPWIIIGFICIFFILNVNPPFGGIFIFFQENIPLFKELFRFPFTKFSIFLVFVYALFFGYFSSFLMGLAKKYIGGFMSILVFTVLFSSIIVFSLPAFNGYLINPAMRVDIPDRYFEMFDYFDSRKDYGRVLHLPIHSFWGWVTYSWGDGGVGYQGAGFLWFGIKQPLIDREFDRWNIANEQPYREISTAIYSQDGFLLKKYLEKYKIRWITLDKSVLAPGMDKRVLFYDEIEKMFSEIQDISLEKDFGGGLLVYEYSPEEDYNRVEELSSYVESKNSLFKEYYDPLYMEYGDYVSSGTITHQFLGFNTVNENIDNSLVFSDSTAVYFKLPYGENDLSTMESISVSLFLKNIEGTDFIDVVFENTSVGTIPLNMKSGRVYLLKFEKDYFVLNDLPEGGFIGSSLISSLKYPDYSIYYINEKINIDTTLYSNLENCDPMGPEKSSSYSLEKIDSGFRLIGKNTLACVTSSLSKFLDSNLLGPVAVSFSSDSNLRPLDFCMLDNKTGLCIDYLLKDRYFVSDISSDLSRYDLRFYTDARNVPQELGREYRDIQILLFQEVLNGTLTFSIEDEIPMIGYLYFLKKDYLTIEPRDLEGNRRVCKQGQGFTPFNFMDTGSGLIFNSTKDSLCDSYTFPLASHETGHVLEIGARNIEGVPLRVCLTNEYSKRCDIEVSLPDSKSMETYYYLVSPMGEGTGYTVNISNYVFGNTMSKNELEYVSLVPIPYRSVEKIKILEPSEGINDLLVLNEAYDKGWFTICGPLPCMADHVKVNNWSNGWVFKDVVKNNVSFIYLPQILEWAGFVILSLIALFSFKYNEKKH